MIKWVKDNSIITNSAFKLFLDFSEKDNGLVLGKSCIGTGIGISKHLSSTICCIENLDNLKIGLRLTDSFCSKNNLKIVVGKLDNLPFKSNAFNIICLHRIENLKNRLENKINEIKRVGKLNGLIYLSYEKNNCFFNLFNFFYWVLKREIEKLGIKMSNIYHYKSFEDVLNVEAYSKKKACYFLSYLTEIKKEISANNKGYVIVKKRSEEILSIAFLHKIKQKIEGDLNLKLTECEKIQIGMSHVINADFGNVIVKMPQSEVGLYCCERNFQSLIKLEKNKIDIIHPYALGKGDLLEQNYYVETKIEGKSMDRKSIKENEKKRIIQYGSEVLSKLATSSRSFYDESRKEVISNEFKIFIKNLRPKDSEIIIKFSEILHEYLLKSRVNLAIVHGDFKISNCILRKDCQGYKLGFIDWDRCSIMGMPLIDFLYFEVHNQFGTNASLYENMWRVSRNWKSIENLFKYIEKLKLNVKLQELLTLFAIIYYINRSTIYVEIYRNWFKANGQFFWNNKWYEDVVIKNVIIPTKKIIISLH
jgi:aminoglycoside phosphotransferase (APT) family kinase protein